VINFALLSMFPSRLCELWSLAAYAGYSSCMTMLAMLTGILSCRFWLEGFAGYFGWQAGSDGNAAWLSLFVG